MMETCKICLNEVEQWRYFPGMGYACDKCLHDHGWSEETQDLLLLKFRQIALQDREKYVADLKDKYPNVSVSVEHVISLRDQLAMSAPFESIEKCLRAREDYGDLTDRKYLELVCDARYYYADTMMKQREVKSE